MKRNIALTLAATAALMLGAQAALAQGNGQGKGNGQMGAHFIEQWDADGDGRVTLDEARGKRADVFAMFDKDDNGAFDATEWAGVAEHLAAEEGGNGQGKGGGHGKGRGPGVHVHAAMTPEFNDADGNGTVTLEEFTGATDRLFTLLDTDGDGAVSAADFGRG